MYPEASAHSPLTWSLKAWQGLVNNHCKAKEVFAMWEIANTSG